MRCPDCNKFTSLDNGDPEVESIEASVDENVTITAQVRGTRNCADCGTTLKELSMEMQETVPVADFEIKPVPATPELKAQILTKAQTDDSIEWGVEEDGGEVDESGGGRYKKNKITTTINYTITGTVELDEADYQLTHEGTLSSENAAGEFEECC